MGVNEDKFDEIFTRLRETEAQTREQNERISALCDRIDNFTTVTDRFFELEDRRHESDNQRFQILCDHEKRLSDRASEREAGMWKIITMLIGALILSVFGPKVATEILQTYGGGGKTPVSYFYYSPIISMPTDDLVCANSQRSDVNV